MMLRSSFLYLRKRLLGGVQTPPRDAPPRAVQRRQNDNLRLDALAVRRASRRALAPSDERAARAHAVGPTQALGLGEQLVGQKNRRLGNVDPTPKEDAPRPHAMRLRGFAVAFAAAEDGEAPRVYTFR